VPALVQRYSSALGRQNRRIVQRLPHARLSAERRPQSVRLWAARLL
jgi:hypothetical protein